MAVKPGKKAKKSKRSAAKTGARDPRPVAADRAAPDPASAPSATPPPHQWTARLQSFCDHYLALGESNGAEAARRAGYSANKAKQRASLILKRPDVQAYLTARRAPVVRALVEQHKLSLTRVLEEAALSAFSDIADVATLEDGQFSPKDFKDMDPAARRNIASITAAPGMFGMKYTIKLYDKGQAQDRITNLLGMIPPEMTDLTMAERAELLARIIENGTRRRQEREATPQARK